MIFSQIVQLCRFLNPVSGTTTTTTAEEHQPKMAAAAGALPNGPLQVVFSFDTTGSMSGALMEVRGRISDMLQRLQTDIPAVTTAVVAHGDYQDCYVTKHVDFTNNLKQLVDFVNTVGTTGGGDEPEAYEVMLRLVRRDLSWTPGSQRVLVVIGDAFPHPPTFHLNKDRIDWKKETQSLKDNGVKIYGVQVNSSPQSTTFFKTMTTMTDGQHLKLSQFGTLCDVIMAICYREKGAQFFDNYEAEVRAREGRMALHKDLEGVFGVLRRADSAASSTGATSASKTPKSRPVTTGAKKTSPAKKSVTISAAKKLVASAASKTVDSRSSRRGKPGSRKRATAAPRRLIREMVPDTNFRLNTLRWSPWELAVVPKEEKVSGSRSGEWQCFMGGAAQARTGPALPGALQTSAARRGAKARSSSVMCEAAVQTRPGARRHVVWCRVLPAASATRLSLCRLFLAPSVRAQLGRVMRGGCRVWVRWARVGGAGDAEGLGVRQQVRDLYDYAWCARKGCYREVFVPNGDPAHKLQICGSISAS